jgi:hypothetical protein
MLIIAFFAGVYGYLFPGTINTTIMYLYGTKNYVALLWILCLAFLFEFIYCFLTLTLLARIAMFPNIEKALEILCALVALVIGLWMLPFRRQQWQEKNNSILLRCVFSIVVHPQQIGYWLVVFALVSSIAKITDPAIFALVNLLGCGLIYWVYMVWGNKLMSYLKLNFRSLQTIIGVLYLISALSMGIKLLLPSLGAK